MVSSRCPDVGVSEPRGDRRSSVSARPRLLGLLVFLSAIPVAQAAPLPDDPRLAPARAELQATIDRAQAAGLPDALLVDKVKEGLAKGVPTARIAQVVQGLAGALDRARTEAQPHLPAPPAALLKAIVEAHTLGASADDLRAVLASSAPSGASTRAVEVLADLAQRGYPPSRAARTVALVAARQPAALDTLAAHAEALTRLRGVTRAEALEALGRAASQGQALDSATPLGRGRDGAGPGGPASDEARGPNRESTGPRGPVNGRGSGGAGGHGKGHP